MAQQFWTIGMMEGAQPVSPPSRCCVCFAAGTRIATERGSAAVEALESGRAVVTLGGGIGRVDRVEGCGRDAAVVRIGAGSLGGGLPVRDLVVAAGHRVVVRSGLAMDLFDMPEVLVAADRLTGVAGVTLDAAHGARCYRLRLGAPAFVFANGVPVELADAA